MNEMCFITKGIAFRNLHIYLNKLPAISKNYNRPTLHLKTVVLFSFKSSKGRHIGILGYKNLSTPGLALSHIVLIAAQVLRSSLAIPVG